MIKNVNIISQNLTFFKKTSNNDNIKSSGEQHDTKHKTHSTGKHW